MDSEILELTRKLCRLAEKEAKKEKRLNGEAKVFTEFLKDLEFYLGEFEEE